MAIGFGVMWLTGVLVTNMEGIPYFMEDDRQGVLRDFHKSVGITLLFLLFVRLGVRFVRRSPPLPEGIPRSERRIAHFGHAALYLIVIATCAAGFAIADLHDYGNAYFGIELPKAFPSLEQVAGWSATPWSYILHAVLAYGLLALVIGHVAAVWSHARWHQVNLLQRVLPHEESRATEVLARVTWIAVIVCTVVVVLGVKAFVTLGPQEEPRNFKDTTPWSARAEQHTGAGVNVPLEQK